MKTMGILFLSAIFSSASLAGNSKNCNHSKKIPFKFSSDNKNDSLLIKIVGEPCQKANVEITIRDSDSKLLYSYKSLFLRHIVGFREGENLNPDAVSLIKNMLAKESFGITSKLPKWVVPEKYYEENYQYLQISKKEYSALRKKHWRSYTHLVHYEGWKTISYDRENHKTVVISSGTL